MDRITSTALSETKSFTDRHGRRELTEVWVNAMTASHLESEIFVRFNLKLFRF